MTPFFNCHGDSRYSLPVWFCHEWVGQQLQSFCLSLHWSSQKYEVQKTQGANTLTNGALTQTYADCPMLKGRLRGTGIRVMPEETIREKAALVACLKYSGPQARISTSRISNMCVCLLKASSLKGGVVSAKSSKKALQNHGPCMHKTIKENGSYKKKTPRVNCSKP